MNTRKTNGPMHVSKLIDGTTHAVELHGRKAEAKRKFEKLVAVMDLENISHSFIEGELNLNFQFQRKDGTISVGELIEQDFEILSLKDLLDVLHDALEFRMK